MSTKGWSTKNVSLYLASFLVIIFASLVLLKFVDLLLAQFTTNSNELFPPRQKVIYRTSEFDALATINNFGFRGAETELKKNQIAVVGDSSTFGFGNKDSETWPHQLRLKLLEAGMPFDVYNLGVPGTDTLFHIAIAKTYVEQIKPKYLILSVLLSDDFQQVHEAKFGSYVDFSRIKSALKVIYPTLYRYYKCKLAWYVKGNPDNIPIVTASWKDDSFKYLAANDASYAEDVRQRIESGDINPSLLYLAKKYPDRAWSFWSKVLNEKSSESATFRLLEEEISKLNEVVLRNGGQLVIFSMPSGAYVRSAVYENYKKFGFSSTKEQLVDVKPETLLGSLSHRIGVDFIPSHPYFRSHDSAFGELFFPYDGHLTREGNLLVANLVHRYLQNIVTAK